jgi:phospholipid transport system substrate-binding protein
MMLQLDRRAFCASLVVAMALLGSPPQAQAQGTREPSAEAFMQGAAEKVLAIIGDRSLDEGQRAAAFHRVIDEVVDVPKVTTFVLGKYARTITPAQKTQFAQAFRIYAESVYRSRMNNYHGAAVRITGSMVRKPGDVIVATEITGGQVTKPQAVSWRVIGAPGAWRVVDVQFQGVWLAITQQQDFVSTVDNAHGDIGVLIARLQSDVQRAAKR